MIQKFEKQMRKNVNKGNYSIDIKSSDGIDDEKFHPNKRGALVCEVIICYKDEFENIENQIQSLEDCIEEKNKIIKKLQDELSDIDQINQKEIIKIKEENSAKVDELNEDLHDKDLQIQKTKTEYETKIGQIKEDYQKEISSLKESQFNSEYHMKISDHEKELNKMRGNCLKLRVRENKEYSSYIEELDNLGRLEKFRNKDKAILKEMKAYNVQSIDDEAIDVNFNLIKKAE